MMTRRERLMATFRGEAVDRPAVCFYEIGGFVCDPSNPDPYNIYNSPSWAPLIQLMREKSDILQFTWPKVETAPVFSEFSKTERWEEGTSRFRKTTVSIAGRELTTLIRRDKDTDTEWTLHHLLKDEDDLDAYLQLPDEFFACDWNCDHISGVEEKLGDSGLPMIDIADPLCLAADLFSMEDYTITAMTEPEKFHQLLERFARRIYPNVGKIAREHPGHVWRIFGPEYAGEPYLPPYLFEEYVNRYAGPMVKMIQKTGGFARLHAHGRMTNILPHIAAMGVDALDPIEPPPQGDIELIDVRQKYGSDMVLFGNLEITDLENLAPDRFEKKVAQALEEGTAGDGRGFVLMPSASPYGREISAATMANYETMIRLAENRS